LCGIRMARLTSAAAKSRGDRTPAGPHPLVGGLVAQHVEVTHHDVTQAHAHRRSVGTARVVWAGW
jgi:hypothetical protein